MLAMRSLRSQVSVKAVESAYRSVDDLGDLGRVLDQAPIFGVEEIGKQETTRVELLASLDVHSPSMQRAARERTADLVREVEEESKRTIRRIILNSQRRGVPPSVAAKDIARVVGLTERQGLAVTNFSDGLRRLQRGELSRRQLARQWSLGPKPRRTTGLSDADIDRLAGRYADRLLRYRALNIARTETITASALGQQATWEQMLKRGVLPRDARKAWIVTRDDRLCPRCLSLDGVTVAVRGRFTEAPRPGKGERVTTLTPPLHASCRCALALTVAPPERERERRRERRRQRREAHEAYGSVVIEEPSIWSRLDEQTKALAYHVAAQLEFQRGILAQAAEPRGWEHAVGSVLAVGSFLGGIFLLAASSAALESVKQHMRQAVVGAARAKRVLPEVTIEPGQEFRFRLPEHLVPEVTVFGPTGEVRFQYVPRWLREASDTQAEVLAKVMVEDNFDVVAAIMRATTGRQGAVPLSETRLRAWGVTAEEWAEFLAWFNGLSPVERAFVRGIRRPPAVASERGLRAGVFDLAGRRRAG